MTKTVHKASHTEALITFLTLCKENIRVNDAPLDIVAASVKMPVYDFQSAPPSLEDSFMEFSLTILDKDNNLPFQMRSESPIEGCVCINVPLISLAAEHVIMAFQFQEGAHHFIANLNELVIGTDKNVRLKDDLPDFWDAYYHRWADDTTAAMS